MGDIMSGKVINLELVSKEIEENYNYIIRERKYKWTCGENYVIFLKERPNGYYYQATFADVFCDCEKCENKYKFSGGTAVNKE